MKESSGAPGKAGEGPELVAALAGDHEAFRELTGTYTRELHLHCYRMLGSFHDAEDAMQETLFRAWRHLATFQGRSSFRAWLYRIATNVCLKQGPRQRTDPPVLPKTLAEAVARSTEPASNLSPYPDALLDELEAASGDPVAEYDLRESVQLAFLAAVQLLPPRQRAVLILHDVLGWSAGEVAELLDSTTASVNSAVNRARVTLQQQRVAGRLQTGRVVPTDAVARSLVQRYVAAWHAADIGALARSLKSDVVMTMPPLPLRYTGREAVAELLAAIPTGSAREQFRFVPTRANRQSALAAYRLDPDGQIHRAWGMFILSADGDAIAEITAFADPMLVPAFGLPAELERDSAVFALNRRLDSWTDKFRPDLGSLLAEALSRAAWLAAIPAQPLGDSGDLSRLDSTQIASALDRCAHRGGLLHGESPAPALQPSTQAPRPVIGGSTHRTRCGRDRP